VTDSSADETEVEYLRQAGVRVHVVDDPSLAGDSTASSRN